jgi:hypothetical protein
MFSDRTCVIGSRFIGQVRGTFTGVHNFNCAFSLQILRKLNIVRIQPMTSMKGYASRYVSRFSVALSAPYQEFKGD